MADDTPADEQPGAPAPSPRRPGRPREAAAPAQRQRHVSGRAAARKVDDASHIRVTLPLLGTVRLPEPQRLTYYAAIGALGVLGVLEWPVALVLAGGHALASDQHNRAVQQFGTHSKTPDPGRRVAANSVAVNSSRSRAQPMATVWPIPGPVADPTPSAGAEAAGPAPSTSGPTLRRGAYLRMLTARATTRATVIREMADCNNMIILAQRVRGMVSVGLKAVALVKDTYK